MDIKRTAQFLRALAWIGAALVVGRPLLGWSDSLGLFATVSEVHFARVLSGPAPQGFVLILLMFPPYVSIAWGLVQLAAFCTHIALEQHFTRNAVRMLARLGWAIVAAALLLPMTRLLALAWIDDLSFGAIFQTVLRLPALMSMMMGAIFGIIIIIFSSLLEKSVQLQDENSSFI